MNDMNMEIANFMIGMIFEEETKEGKSFDEIMQNLIKGEEKDKEIIKDFKRLGVKPSKNMIDFARFRAKLHIVEVISRSDVFDKNEICRLELSNYMIELANELRCLKGDCSK